MGLVKCIHHVIRIFLIVGKQWLEGLHGKIVFAFAEELLSIVELLVVVDLPERKQTGQEKGVQEK